MSYLNSTIVDLQTRDIRFPTSLQLDGSDAMHPDPDYSAAYVTVVTDYSGPGGLGYGFAFTIGRGNDVQVAAIDALKPLLMGRRVADVVGDLGDTYSRLANDAQLRWLGPEKGVIHMAAGAVLNALWDLRCRGEQLPLWKLLSKLSVDELISVTPFQYLSDALSPSEAREILESSVPERTKRIRRLEAEGYPAYSTSPGWLGYTDQRLADLCVKAIDEGFRQVKLKVGERLADDRRRLAIARDAVGDDIRIAVDANQRWDVGEAITWIRALSEFDLAWVEEPTSPDDILGCATIARAVAPVKIATGEHVHNRVMFKQLLQAKSLSVLQLDATRVGGVNENLAILLLSAKFGVPVNPHAGGVGLCELVQHLSFFDYVSVSGSLEGRSIEYVDHLHEHFVAPAVVSQGSYQAPRQPGFSSQMVDRSLASYSFPSGPVWQDLQSSTV